MKEVRLLLLSEAISIADKLRNLLGSTAGLPYTIISKQSFDDAQRAIDSFPVQVVMADMAHEDAIRLLNHLKQSEFNGALVALFDNEGAMTPTSMARCPVQDTLLKSRMDPLLVRQVLRFARQRRHSQLLLAREQSLFTELLNNTPDRIYFKDRNSRFLRVNMGMARAFGFENPDDLRGKSDFDLHPYARAQDAFNDEQKIIQTGQALLGKDETEQHADGHMRWVNTLKMPLRNARREIIGTMGISRDITNEKLAELALEREKKLLSTLLEVLPDNLYVKDANDHYIISNPSHWRELGLENEDQILGKSSADFFPPEINRQLSDQDKKVRKTNEPITNFEEFRPATELHPARWLLTSKVPLKDPVSGEVLLVGISRDITEQKHTQEKLENVIRELRDTQSELIEAEKLKIVGRLASGVAHEVKNPLNIILMAADTLCSEDIDEDERKELCKEIRTAVLKANDVIFELLDFSAAKELKLDLASINLVVERAAKLIHHRSLKAKVKVRLELAADLPQIPMDPQKMEQVLINLIFNAINAMPNGGVIEIRTALEKIGLETEALKGQLIERFRIGDEVMTIAVSDNGMGIDKDNLGKVFEPFFTTGPSGKSSGLGLMVTKNIVERHHGVLTLRNRHTGGVEAKVYLHLDPKIPPNKK